MKRFPITDHFSEIVLLSGFNNLGLARLPASVRGEHGAFFNCNQFFQAAWLLYKHSRNREKENCLLEGST